jgi:DNA-binding NarL/FixJ family response regulator
LTRHDPNQISIAIADDHEVVRLGLRTLLQAEADFRVVAEAADGLEAARVVERSRPDVLLLDLSMPGMGGFGVLRKVSRVAPLTRVLVMSIHSSESYAVQALRGGALGYATKDVAGGELVVAIRRVAAGHRYLAPAISERAIAAYLDVLEEAGLDVWDTLTDREQEVLQLLAEGKTNAQIAEKFFISPRTVESHRANVMRKLGLRTQTDLVVFAIRRGLLPLD